MRNGRGLLFGLIGSFTLGVLAGGRAAAETPSNLVAAGANQVAYTGSPDALFYDPGIFWYTPPTCSGAGAASDGTSPARILRGTTYAAPPRALLSVNPPRPATTCNPYRLISNIAVDTGFIYFVDNQGPSGHFALQRRSRDANEADPSTLLVDLGTTLTSAEVNAQYPTVLFVILHRAGSLDSISEYWKSNGGLLAANFEIGGPDEIRNLQYDGKFLYWIRGTELRADDTTNGAMKTVVPSGVSAYFAEGFYQGQGCDPERGCDYDVAFVLYGKGNQILLDDAVFPGGGYPPYYTATDPNATIHAITRDNSDNVYHLERRAANPGGVFDREERLYRNSTLIFGPVNNGGPGFDSLTTDLTNLYFHNRATNALLKLPNNAAALPIYDLSGTGIEVTQGIQNPANDVTLIEGKRTMVRFYVKSNQAVSVAGVTAFLDVYNTQGYLGRLQPVNRIGKLLLVRPDPKRMNVNDSFLFEVPLDWTFSTALTFQGIVNPLAGVREDNFANNSANSPLLIFTQSPRMLLEVVEFRYSNAGGLAIGGAFDDVNSVRWMRELYPVASTNSGGINDPGPGLRVAFRSVTDNALETRVDQTNDICNSRICKQGATKTTCCSAGQTDTACTNLLAGVTGTIQDNRNMCAGDYVVQQLQALRTAGTIPKDRYIYGSIAYGTAPATSFTRGFNPGGETIAVGPMKDIGTEQNYMAHEIGHALGRGHPTPGAAPVCPGQSTGDDAYPYVAARIGGRLVAGGPFGGPNVPDEVAHARLDFGDPNNPLNPFVRVVGASTAGDIMSYCAPYGISSWNFEAIYNRLAFFPLAAAGLPAAADLPNAAAAAIPGDWLLAYGSFPRKSGAGAFGVVRRFDSVADVPPLVDGGYVLELRDGGDALLASHAFTPRENSEGEDQSLSFEIVVPFEPETRTLRVVESATSRVVATLAVSAGRPEISDVQLVDPPNPVTGVVTLEWTASDPDGDPLTFDIFYSHDAGTTWQPIGLSLSGTSVPIESEALPGGTGRFRVEASDGAQSARAESATFEVASKPPIVLIANPGDGLQLQWSQLVNLVGEVRDPQEQPIPDASIHWSNAYRSLGTGPAVSVSDLEIGTNVITLSATNAAGLTATTSVTVVVGDQIRLPGPILASTPASLSWNVEGNATALQTGSLLVTNVGGGGSVGFVAESNQPWLTLNGAASASLAAPATLAISADPSGLPDLSTSSAEIQITNASDPSKVVVVPVTLLKGSLMSGNPFADADGDGVADDHDNCTLVSNFDQRDSNGDGYGNACDPDLNNDGIVNFGDLAKMKGVFFTTDADADLNGDGVVNFADLARLKTLFFKPPGPSAKAAP